MKDIRYCNKAIDDMLKPFATVLGKDYNKYQNHVYRVFLNCLLLDSNPANEVKYAIAAVFHDIGIWTNDTIDYLDPSLIQARLYLNQIHKEEWVEEIEAMIYWHHKTTAYKGRYHFTVENFRKADWIDVSLGTITFGADRKKINAYRRLLPNYGFHFFLLKKIVANLFQHPLHPMPMFKK